MIRFRTESGTLYLLDEEREMLTRLSEIPLLDRVDYKPTNEQFHFPLYKWDEPIYHQLEIGKKADILTVHGRIITSKVTELSYE